MQYLIKYVCEYSEKNIEGYFEGEYIELMPSGSRIKHIPPHLVCLSVNYQTGGFLET